MNANRVRGLGVASRKRTLAAPNVPTFVEAGIGDIVAENWYGVLAPAGIPPGVRAKLERELMAVAQLPEIRERFLAIALEPTTLNGSEFKAVIEADLKKWSALVKAAKIKVE